MRSFVLLLLAPLLLFAAEIEDRAIGTWRFLPKESTYQSAPAPRESKRQWIKDGPRVKFIHDGINADAKPFHTEFSAAYDNKLNPFTGGTLYDSVALNLRNPSRVDQTFTLKGKITVKAIRTISKDGRRMTIESRGKKADGTPFRNLLIYERI